MKLTALITTRNRAPLLREAIESVLYQEGFTGELEFLVVDDDSTDETQSVVSSYPTIRYLKTRQGTAAGSRNVGITASTGEWIAFLDDDDVWLPQKLRMFSDAIKSTPDAKMVTSSAHICDWQLNPGAVWDAPDMQKYQTAFEAFLHVVMTPSAVMVRRDVFESVGLFDTSIPRIEDRDMWLRIASHGLRCVSISEPLTRYRVRDGLQEQMATSDYHGTIRVIKKHLHQVVHNRAISLPALAWVVCALAVSRFVLS